MRKFLAVAVAAIMALTGVVATAVPAAADPGHRARGALYVAVPAPDVTQPPGSTLEMVDRAGFVSHIGGLGRVSVQLTLVLSGTRDERGYFPENGSGTYSATGTITTTTGARADIVITGGTFTTLESAYTPPGGTAVNGLGLGEAEVTLTGVAGKLSGVTGSGKIAGGVSCQYFRWASLELQADLELS